MSIRQTRTGSNPGIGPGHDSESDDELELQRTGKKLKVKFNRADLRPLGETRTPSRPPGDPERKPAPPD